MNKKQAQKKIRELAQDEANIVFAPQGEVPEYQAEIDEFLLKVFGIRRAWISDMSSCLDFGNRNWRRKATQAFGISGQSVDARVVDVAKAIRASRQH